MYTPVNPVLLYKSGVKGSKLYRHVFVMKGKYLDFYVQFFYVHAIAESGAIEFDEFVKMYLTLRTKPMDTHRTIKALFKKLDADKDGYLGFR